MAGNHTLVSVRIGNGDADCIHLLTPEKTTRQSADLEALCAIQYWPEVHHASPTPLIPPVD